MIHIIKIKMKAFIAVLLIFQAITIRAQKEYVIEGHLTGVEDSCEILLMQNEGNLFTSIATDTIIGGRFIFSGKTDKVQHMAIISNAPGFPSQWLDIYVAPSVKIKITGSNKLFKTWTVESSVKEQREINRYTISTRNELDRLQELSILQNTLRQRKTSGAERKMMKVAIDSVSKLQDSIYPLLYSKYIPLMEKSPVTPIWMNKLKEIALAVRYNKLEAFREPAVRLLNKLNDTQKASLEAREIQVTLFPPQTINNGDMVPDNTLADLDGKRHRLSDYRGKYLLVDFWSVGCGPCIMAMPELNKLSGMYTDSLAVISLSLDAKKETWKKASTTHKISWTNLSDGNGNAGIAALFGVEGIPHYALISPEGKLLSSWVGFSKGDLEKRIRMVIK